MKVAVFGLDIEPGKHKYVPREFDKLVKKFEPKKSTPYVIEFLDEDFDKADAIVFDSKKRLDLVLIDLEKVERRIPKVEDEKEKALLQKVQELLEKETLLCDVEFSPDEIAILRHLQFVTHKPALGKDSVDDQEKLIKEIMDKAGVFLFFTAGKKEVHAWELKAGSTAVEAAGKIHSDLARGFIKADIVNCSELDNFFNMAEARSKGLVVQVDKDYIVKSGDIIEIKFNV